MADKQRVLVHVFHEAQGSEASRILGIGTYDGSADVEGEADAAQLAALQAAQLIVEVAPEPVPLPAQDRSRYRATVNFDWEEMLARGDIFSQSGRGSVAPPRLRRGGAPLPIPAPSERGSFTARLDDFTGDLGDILGHVGAGITRALPGGTVITELFPEARAQLDADPRIVIEPLNHSEILAPSPDVGDDDRAAAAPATGEVRSFDIIAVAPDRLPEIEAFVARHMVGAAMTRIGGSTTKVRIACIDTSPLLDEAALLDCVFNVEVVPPAYFCLDTTRALVGLAPLLAGSAGALDGSGQIIAISDGTVDAGHADFGSRVKVAGSPESIPSAHGTHVAGIIAGDGSRSQGRFTGMAPAATLVAQALPGGPDGELQLPLDMAELLAASHAAGARIHNLSLAEARAQSLYSQRAAELDAFVVAHPEMLVVVAAGNDARTERNEWRPPGEVDLGSIASPGIAKNVLTVGASCGGRTSGGRSGSWASFPPGNRFVSAPTAGAAISGRDDAIAAFSGRGWGHGTDRLKPDVVAPGTNIVAARAQGSPDTLWGEQDADYLFSGGTSMAAPVVAGAAALIRQHYVARGHAEPSAALLRATLVAGARWLTGAGAVAAVPALPASQPCAGVDQGFGRIDVARSLALDGSGRRLFFIDVTAAGAVFTSGLGNAGLPQVFARDRDRQRFFFTAATPARPIDIALCFTDPVPGPAGAALALLVQPHGGAPRTGNDRAGKALLPLMPVPDRVNNVQVVRLDATSGGVDVQVKALALLGFRVGFSLVILGDIENDALTPF